MERKKKSFAINKGIGRTVEFKGLKAQYLFIFAGGLLGVLLHRKAVRRFIQPTNSPTYEK